ncbi:MAG: hypothetical protein RR585_05065 [Coprobacillus sp.]
MKNKLQTFSEDEALTHYAMQRQLRKWVIEGEKKLKYEESIIIGKIIDSQTKVIRILLKKYPQSTLD